MKIEEIRMTNSKNILIRCTDYNQPFHIKSNTHRTECECSKMPDDNTYVIASLGKFLDKQIFETIHLDTLFISEQGLMEQTAFCLKHNESLQLWP